MARPTSRYFTPVTKKILAAKKQENIVIDQAFKTSLRAELLSKVVVPPRVEKPDWMDFFRRWKYQIAFVPTAFLLVVVAMQSMKLPQITMQSQTVVPVSGTQNTINGVANVSTADQDVDLLQNVGVNSDAGVSQEKLRTFAGSSVLPSWYQRETATGLSGQQIYEQPLPNYSSVRNVSEKSNVQSSVGVRDNVDILELGQKILFSVSNQKAGGTAAGDVSVGGGTASGDVPGEEMVNLVSDNVKQDVPVVVSTPAQEVVSPVPTKPVYPVMPSPSLPVSAERVLPPKSVSAPVENTSAKVPVQNDIQLPYPLFYQADLSYEEKLKFETELVVPLTNGKDVTLLSVTLAEPGVLMVDVLMRSGVREQHLYRKNVETKGYEEVHYVMRGAYNNDLQYEPAFSLER